jgi:hypothetical protein
VKGHHNIVVREVPLSGDSLNASDVFVLDNGLTIYQLETSQSSGLERVKGAPLPSLPTPIRQQQLLTHTHTHTPTEL